MDKMPHAERVAATLRLLAEMPPHERYVGLSLNAQPRALRPAADEATLRLHALKEEAVEKEHDRLLRLDKERARHEREAETERAGRSSLEERERGRREEEERRAREREARKQRRQGGDLTHEEELQLQQLEQLEAAQDAATARERAQDEAEAARGAEQREEDRLRLAARQLLPSGIHLRFKLAAPVAGPGAGAVAAEGERVGALLAFNFESPWGVRDIITLQQGTAPPARVVLGAAALRAGAAGAAARAPLRDSVVFAPGSSYVVDVGSGAGSLWPDEPAPPSFSSSSSAAAAPAATADKLTLKFGSNVAAIAAADRHRSGIVIRVKLAPAGSAPVA
jgi:hypothetical protein